jgi:hypothetical protein
MDALSLIIGLVLGAASGGAIAFFALRARLTAQHATEQAAARLSRDEAAGLKQELGDLRQQAAAAQQAQAAAQATLAATTARAQELLAAARQERERAEAEAASRSKLEADMRADGAWKPAEAVRDPRGPIWPSATSIQGFLPEL